MKTTPDLSPGEALPRLTMQEIDASGRSASTASKEPITPPIDSLLASWASPPLLLNRTFSGVVATYRIRVKPSHNMLSTGVDPLAIVDKLCGLGECGVAPLRDRIPSIEDVDPEDCHPYWDIMLTTKHGMDAIRNIFLCTQTGCEIDIRIVDGIIGLEEPDGEGALTPPAPVEAVLERRDDPFVHLG